MRLIDADKLKEEITSWGMNDYEPSDFVDAIDEAPTVDPIFGIFCCEDCDKNKRPHGKWIKHEDYNESCRYGCNQCGNLNNIPSEFCPNCGADMREETGECSK